MTATRKVRPLTAERTFEAGRLVASVLFPDFFVMVVTSVP
jgi:hypothetical protein